MKPAEIEVYALRALVSAYALDPKRAVATIDDSHLDVGDFTNGATQALFAKLRGVMREGRQLDVVEVAQATKGNCKPDFVMSVVTHMEPFAEGTVASRVSELRNLTRLRDMSKQLKGLLEFVGGGSAADACLVEVERTLRELRQTSSGGVQTLDGSLHTLIDKLEDVQAGRRESTLATGIEALDYAIGGLQPTLTIVGALPGVGKSALLAGISRNLAARGVQHGVLSLEDERVWLTERIMAEAASVPLFVMGNKPLTSSQMQRVTESFDGVQHILRNIYIEDAAGMTTREVIASARAMVSRGCKAILVDHLGEIRLERSDRHDLDILEALQDLRGIAKTYSVPVIVACHLKRRDGLETKSVPKLTDFAFSAAIERCARVALGLFRPPQEGNAPPVLGVEVLKQTKGPRDFNFKLNVGQLYGIVQHTPVPAGMRQAFSGWRDS